MKRKHKKYSKPKRPFDKSRIDEEREIKKTFGLKNKKEIWKAEAKVKSVKEKAKRLISASESEQQALFERLKKMGLNVESIADVLALDKTDYLKRRLQSIVVKQKLASTPKAARQLISHKKILIDGKVVGSNSFIVPVKLENKITLKKSSKKKVKSEKEAPEVNEKIKEEEVKDE